MASYELQVQPQVSEIPRLIEWIAACCSAAGLDDEIRFKMTLALDEAVTNVITHAFVGRPPPHLVQVRLEITAQLIAAEVIDNGHVFDPTDMPEPDLSLPLEERQPGGLGVHLMRTVTDRVQYSRSADGNVLRLEKNR